MRPSLALVLALASSALSGCFTPDAERAQSMFGQGPMFSNGPTGDDVVQLRVALVERPAGDAALNGDLWQLINERVLDSDQQELLAHNGFRIGRCGAPPPALQSLITAEMNSSCSRLNQPVSMDALQKLIAAEKSNRPDLRGIFLRAGNSYPVTLAPPWPSCRFHVDGDAKTELVELKKATFQLLVVPTLADDGRVTLRFTPSVKHGDLSTLFRPSRSATGELEWKCEPQKVEAYSSLAWELTVDPDDTVVIGTNIDARETVGQCSFVNGDGPRQRQRLLVLRVSRAAAGSTKPELVSGVTPLALQAGVSVRGNAP